MRPFDKHLFMSVTKAYVALIIAMLQARGLLDVSPKRRGYCYRKPAAAAGRAYRCRMCWIWLRASMQRKNRMVLPIPTTPITVTKPRWAGCRAGEPQRQASPVDTYAYVAGLKRKEPPGQGYEYTSSTPLSWPGSPSA